MRVLLCVLLIAACGKAKPECQRDARALGELLVAAASDPFPPFDVKGMHLVIRDDVTQDAKQPAPTVRIEKAGLKYTFRYTDEAIRVEDLRDRLSASADQIREDLDSGKLRQKYVPEPRRLYLLIEPTTPASQVIAVLDAALATKLSAVGFVFEVPQPLKPPPRSSLDDALDKSLAKEGGGKATELAELLKQEVKSCSPLDKVFSTVGSDEGANKAMVIALGVAPALEACNCDVNIPRVRSALFRVMYVERPTRVLLLDPDQPAQEIVVDPASTWAELNKQLTPATKNVRFVVR